MLFFLQNHSIEYLFNKGRDAALAPAEGSKSRVCFYCYAAKPDSFVLIGNDIKFDITQFDVVPNLLKYPICPVLNVHNFRNIISADLNYGVAKVENALWPYQSCCVPKMHQLYVKSVVSDFNSILIYKIL